MKKIRPLNFLGQTQFQNGVLVKVIEGPDWGAADLCPKPELGDNDFATEIKNGGPLYVRALELAMEDLRARKQNISLLQDKPVRNNFLVIDYAATNFNSGVFCNQTVKIKGDRNIKILSKILNSIESQMTLRIDFNSLLNSSEFEVFLESLTETAKMKIEYIEDPTLINSDWKRWNGVIPLAFDFQAGDYDSELAAFRIIKPSRQKIPGDLNRVTLTSAMDHPVGVAHGLRIAQQSAVLDCGFLTLDLFENVGFEKYFLQSGNYLNFTDLALMENGIGMTSDLERLNWIEL